MKKLLLLLLVCALVLVPSLALADKGDLSFADVRPDDWYAEDVAFVTDHGLMQGISDYVFGPDKPTTRAMIVTVLWRMADSPKTKAAATFKDVEEKAYYQQAVTWAAEQKIVTGYNADTFAPEDPITREQLATILYRYAQSLDKGFTGAWTFLPDLSDRQSISEWAYEPVCWMTMNQIIKGDSQKRFAPNKLANRSEAAAMLHRFADVLED